MTFRFTTLAALAALCLAWEPADPLAGDPDAASLERGPAIGEAQLAPYFTAPALKSALSELQAGRPASALRYLPRKPTDSPAKWLRALALKGDEPQWCSLPWLRRRPTALCRAGSLRP